MNKVKFDGEDNSTLLERITAKKNFASSMQSHKMGATYMFDAIHKYLSKEKYPNLANEVNGPVAVKQLPVVGFTKTLKEGTKDIYIHKHIGNYTVGADKGDNGYFGFDDPAVTNTAIRLEGTDHIRGVGFNYPWRVNGVDNIKYSADKEALCIVTGPDVSTWSAILEQSKCGNYKSESDINDFLVQEFKPAFDCAYYNNPLIVGVDDMTIDEINANITAFGKRRRTTDDRQYSYCEFWIDGEYDLYYLNLERNRYEKNGINLYRDLSTEEQAAINSATTLEEKNQIFINFRVKRFAEQAPNYFEIDDGDYQLGFLYINGASDNGEKNMYPYKFKLLSEGGRWRFFQDDLDSIGPTDNQAQDTKTYSIELHDFTSEDKSAYVFKGEDNAFFQLLELSFATKYQQMCKDILLAMIALASKGNTNLEKLMAFYDDYFFSRAQEYFAKSLYNNDAEQVYEEAWNDKNYVAIVDIHPLAQSLGDHYEAEREWFEKRMIYLMSKFSIGGFSDNNDTELGIISFRTQEPRQFELTPVIDLYPTALGGQGQLSKSSERIKSGQSVLLTAVGGGNTNAYIVGVDWLSDIGDLRDLVIDPNAVSVLNIASKRLRRIKLGDEDASTVTTTLESLAIQQCNSLETIDARNASKLGGTIDLTKCPRIIEALFGGTNISAVLIVPGSKIEKLEIPSSITTLDLRNIKFMDTFNHEELSNLRYIRLENVQFNGFEFLKEAYNSENQSLQDIRIIGFNYIGETADLKMLTNFANNLDKDGNEHIYKGIDINGNNTQDNPVLEGSLHIAGNAAQVNIDLVNSKFPAIILTADKIVNYFEFVDKEVERIVAENWGDGTGTTLEQIEAITDIGTVFSGNTTIETFDEFEKFKGVNFPTYSTGVFRDCISLVSIKLPKHLTTIPANFAKDSINMESDITGCFENTTFIGRSAFLNTKIYGELNLPKIADLDSAQNSNFKNTNISKAIIGGTVSIIPTSCFENCANLNEVVLSDNVKSINGNAFAYTGVSSINLENVSELSVSAFRSCTRLQGDINIPNYSGSVGGYCFNGCSSLDSISIGDGVTIIEYMAFSNCTNLKKLDIGAGVTSFNGSVVQNNQALEAIIIRAITPPTATSSPFSKDSGCPIYVPDASVEAYKTATNWVTYADRIMSMFYYLGYIDFADSAVRDICVANFDTDADGVVSIEEAAAVTDIGTLFKGNTSITSFDEFKYFTGLTNLADGAFNQCTKIKELRIPDGVTKIGGSGTSGTGAISRMTSLETLHWGKNITKCNGLNRSNNIKNIYVYDNANYLNVDYGRYESNPLCESTEYVNLFVNGVKTTEFVIPEGVTNIPSRPSVLFKLNINKIHIPASLTTFNLTTGTSGSFLQKCPPVEFEVDSSNESFTAINGVLYDKSITTLYRASGEGEELIIPSSVTYIVENCVSYSHYKKIKVHSGITRTGGRLFSYNDSLKTLIWESTANLPQWTVDYCKSLETILIKADIQSIGNIAFTDCSNLRNLIVDSSNLVTLANWGSNTGFHKGIAFAYVPSDLVDSYKTATTWSTYEGKIKPINVADTLPDIGSVAENDLYQIGEVYWKAELVDEVLTWVEI